MKRTARATLGGTGVFADPAPAPAARVANDRPDRKGKVPMPFWTTEAARRQLRVMAAEEDSTQQDLMTEALNDLFRKRGKPPIA